MAEIVLDRITKRYPDGALAVDNISMDIADGEFIILVGPSGCGKSTTLNMIAGLEDITEGELRIGGKVVNNKTPKDRDIAMVFQSYALYPHMTVRENMGFALKLAKTPPNVIKEKVEEAARILDLTQHLDRRPANLSGGQRQRVAMGRTGVLQQAASPKELYDRPVNLFVAGFIGSPAMNFMSGTLEDGMLRTSLGDFRLSDRLRREVESSGSGRDVIVGLRPENFEDVALVSADNRPHGLTFRASIDVLESLGSDVFVYFTRELGQGVNSAELEELARDSGRAEAIASGG